MHIAPCGRTLGTSSLASVTGPWRALFVGAPFDHLPLVIDDSVGWVPDAPYPHLTPTVRTDQRVPSRALLVPLPVGQPGDDLHRALDHPLYLGQGCLNHHLHLGKRLRGLHAVIPDALEAFGHRMLHHPANKRVHIDGFMLHPFGAVGPVMVRDPVAIIAIDALDGDRG